MKKLFFIIFIIIIVALFLYSPQTSQPSLLQPSTLPSSSPSPPLLLGKLEEINYQDNNYRYAWYKIENLQKLNLYPNFDHQLSSQTLINNHSCAFLISGGFYSTNNQPLGWLVSQNQQLSPPIKSQLFNGFLSIDNQSVYIGQELPDNTPQTGLQTGPLLILNGQILPLTINNDQFRRRMIAVVTEDNQLVFMAILAKDSDSSYSGPLLGDTPAIVSAIAETINLTLNSAINLDGGTASAFFSSDVFLKEFSPIGSYFCI